MDSLIKHKTGCMICALIAMACIVLYWGASISSDAYVFENMDRCHVILFCDGGWMKIKIIDGEGLLSFYGLGAIYVVDSLGRRRKVSGKSVKRESSTFKMLEVPLSRCKSLDQAWADPVWSKFANYGYKVEDDDKNIKTFQSERQKWSVK